MSDDTPASDVEVVADSDPAADVVSLTRAEAAADRAAPATEPVAASDKQMEIDALGGHEELVAHATSMLGSISAFDLQGLNKALSAAMLPGHAGGSSDNEAWQERLHELKDDMDVVLRQLKLLKSTVDALAQRTETIGQSLAGLAQSQAREFHALRTDLLGDRRVLAATRIFEQTIMPLDQFRHMRAGLNARKDKRMIEQLEAVILVLERALRGIGFEPFEAQLGEPFDPQRMVCRGFVKGDPYVVLKALAPGYRAGQHLVRPAEVMIADPAKNLQ
ncbi:MAG TPA: nucleotide exchange factor GrpE [Pirellulales bacterium]|jgi:molecular chaperone GrpE (heat shock protein)|nr:nucleotide exchange factor GrpE [Pirellulales bacterium]